MVYRGSDHISVVTKMLEYLCLVLFVAGTLAAPSNEDFLLQSISTDSERIVGAKDAAAGEFPYQASLRSNNGKTPYCGGTIIAKRFILTAAQCTQWHYSQPENVQVVVGARLLSSGGTHYALDRIVNHPRFNILTIENDVSVLRTVRSITWTRNIQRIALPGSMHGDLLAVVSGWGQIKVSVWIFSSILSFSIDIFLPKFAAGHWYGSCQPSGRSTI